MHGGRCPSSSFVYTQSLPRIILILWCCSFLCQYVPFLVFHLWMVLWWAIKQSGGDDFPSPYSQSSYLLANWLSEGMRFSSQLVFVLHPYIIGQVLGGNTAFLSDN